MLWKWEQGRLEYFQFDALRKVAKFGIANNLRQATRSELENALELPFRPDDEAYPPWRNYGRLFQIAMIAVPHGPNKAKLTSLGRLLAEDGKVTTDEYLHFLAQATTQPSPAHTGWNHTEPLRYPLLFTLRFILARAAQQEPATNISDVINSYAQSGFRGDEGRDAFLGIPDSDSDAPLDTKDARQPSVHT